MKISVVFKFLLVFALCNLFVLPIKAQYFEQADNAFAKAKAEGKPLLIIFSGSDWCSNCIRFEKKVVRNPLFTDYAATHLVILISDFPQRKKQLSALVTQNESLAAQYDANGTFPKIVVVDAAQPALFKSVTYTNQSAAEFVSDIKRQLPALGYAE